MGLTGIFIESRGNEWFSRDIPPICNPSQYYSSPFPFPCQVSSAKHFVFHVQLKNKPSWPFWLPKSNQPFKWKLSRSTFLWCYFWVYRWNPIVRLLKQQPLTNTFLFYYLLCSTFVDCFRNLSSCLKRLLCCYNSSPPFNYWVFSCMTPTRVFNHFSTCWARCSNCSAPQSPKCWLSCLRPHPQCTFHPG